MGAWEGQRRGGQCSRAEWSHGWEEGGVGEL